MAMTDTSESTWLPYMPEKAAWAAPFWSGLSDGKLMLQRCTQCDVQKYPPTERHCAACGSEFSWVVASGRAKLWSWVTFHREYFPAYPLAPPYTVLMAELAEGLRMLATLAEDVTPDTLKCDSELQFIPLELAAGEFIPGFTVLEGTQDANPRQ